MNATYAPCFANGFHTTTKGAHTLAWGREFRIGERRLLGENIAIAWKLQSELLQRRFWVDSIINTGSNELRHRSDLIFAEDRKRLPVIRQLSPLCSGTPVCRDRSLPRRTTTGPPRAQSGLCCQ